MSKPRNLTIDSSLLARLSAWADERFPYANGILFLMLYAAGMLVGRGSVSAGPITIGLLDIAGFIAVVAFFLMLRVFDEHKDYELDCLNHPQRILQSGLITLGHLKVLGVLAILAQIGVSLSLDAGLGRISITWFIVVGWSSLMAVEFFCGEWLEKRLVLYALSHMVVMPMALVWMAQMGAGSETLPNYIGWLAASSFFSGASFEVARKMKAPEDEIETIDSYTKSLGVKTAPIVVLCLLLTSAGALILLLCAIFDGILPGYWYALLVAPVVPGAITLLSFRRSPSAKAAKRCEATVALAMLAGYSLILVGLYIKNGFQWT